MNGDLSLKVYGNGILKARKIIKQVDLIFMQKDREHKIRAIGDKVAIRIAVSKYDVDQVDEDV